MKKYNIRLQISQLKTSHSSTRQHEGSLRDSEVLKAMLLQIQDFYDVRSHHLDNGTNDLRITVPSSSG
jgi:hypothetical protein